MTLGNIRQENGYREKDIEQNKHSLESVQRDQAFISHISTWHHLHHVQTLLQILYWAQPLQAGVLNVDTLVKLNFFQMFQTIWEKQTKTQHQYTIFFASK